MKELIDYLEFEKKCCTEIMEKRKKDNCYYMNYGAKSMIEKTLIKIKQINVIERARECKK